MKYRILFILLGVTLSVYTTMGQAPGIFGRTSVISGGVGIGQEIDPYFNVNGHFAIEKVRNRILMSGLYYKNCKSPADNYLQVKKNGYSYSNKTDNFIHDFLWRWTWITNSFGGVSPVGRFATVAAGMSISKIKMITPYTYRTNDSIAYKQVFMPTATIGMGRRAILSPRLLLNWGCELSYRLPINYKFAQYDSYLASASMFRVYLGMCFMAR